MSREKKNIYLIRYLIDRLGAVRTKLSIPKMCVSKDEKPHLQKENVTQCAKVCVVVAGMWEQGVENVVEASNPALGRIGNVNSRNW